MIHNHIRHSKTLYLHGLNSPTLHFIGGGVNHILFNGQYCLTKMEFDIVRDTACIIYSLSGGYQHDGIKFYSSFGIDQIGHMTF